MNKSSIIIQLFELLEYFFRFGFGFESFYPNFEYSNSDSKIFWLRIRFGFRFQKFLDYEEDSGFRFVRKKEPLLVGGGSIRPPLLNAILLSRLAGMPTQVWLIAFITYPSCSPYVLLHGFVFSFVHSRNPLQIAQMSSSFEMVLFGNRKTHK